MDASASNPIFHLRLATQDDIPMLRLLIDASVRGLHTAHYTPTQISSALKNVYGVDTQLLQDGTYFVVETTATTAAAGGRIVVGCGGWSRRATLYGGDVFNSRNDNVLDPDRDAAKIRAFFVHPEWTRRGIGGILLRACEEAARRAGFKRVEMGSTLTGVPFYASCGYVELVGGRVEERLENGDVLAIVRMGKELV
jgi:GNAT superfamily N-acetyltransferase